MEGQKDGKGKETTSGGSGSRNSLLHLARVFFFRFILLGIFISKCLSPFPYYPFFTSSTEPSLPPSLPLLFETKCFEISSKLNKLNSSSLSCAITDKSVESCVSLIWNERNLSTKGWRLGEEERGLILVSFTIFVPPFKMLKTFRPERI